MNRQIIFLLTLCGAVCSMFADADEVLIPVDATPVFVNDSALVDAEFTPISQAQWFVFFAEKGIPHMLLIPDASVDEGIDPQIELFKSDGSAFLASPFNFGFEGEGEFLDLKNGFEQSDFYFIRVSNLQPSNGRYQIQVFVPLAPESSIYRGKLIDQCLQTAVVGADIFIDTQFTRSHTTGEFLISVNSGLHSIAISHENFEIKKLDVEVLEKETLDQTIELVPLAGCEDPKQEPLIAIYDISNGLLQLDAVQADNKIYSVVLKNQLLGSGFLFSILSIEVVDTIRNESNASYDFDSKVLQIPEIKVEGSKYKADLTHDGDFLFTVLNVEMLE